MGWSPRYDLYGDLLRQRMITRFGTARLRHARLHGLDMSRDGRFIASGSADGSVVIWKAATGKRLYTGPSPSPVRCVRFSPDGELLAAGSDDGGIRLWDMRQPRPVRELQGGSAVRDVGFSPDGEVLVAASSECRALPLGAGEVRILAEAAGPAVASVAVSPDGARVAFARGDALHVVDPTGEGLAEDVHTIESGELTALCWMAPKVLLAVSTAGTMVRWTPDQVDVFALSATPFTSVAVSPVADTVAIGDEHGQIRLLQLAQGVMELDHIVAHDGPVSALLWSPGGRVIASLSGGQHSPRLWASDSGKRIWKGEGHEGGIRSLGCSTGAQVVVTAAADDRLACWDAEGRFGGMAHWKDADRSEPESWREAGQVYRLPPAAVAVSPDGREVVAGVDRWIVRWSLDRPAGKGVAFAAASLAQPEILHRCESPVRWVRIDPVTSRIAVGAGRQFVLVGMVDEMLDEEAVDAVFVGQTVMVACNGNQVRRWRSEDGRYLDAVPAEISFGDRPVALSFDGERGAVQDGRDVVVWDTEDGQVLQRLACEQPVLSWAWEPENRYLAAGCADGGIRVFDLSRDEVSHTLFGHDGGVTALVWVGQDRLLSGAEDCTAVLWQAL